MASATENRLKLLIWNADTPFIRRIEKLKASVEETPKKESYSKRTFLSHWTIISSKEKLEKINWPNVEKVLCLAELKWNKKDPILFQGLELIKKIRFQKSLVIPIGIASFLPLETLKKVTDNDPVLIELIDGKNYIKLKNELWIKTDFDKNFMAAEDTKILILHHFFEREKRADSGEEHNTLYKLVDDMMISLGAICGYNYLPKDFYKFEKRWSRVNDQLRLIRNCLYKNPCIEMLWSEQLKTQTEELNLFFEYSVLSPDQEAYSKLYSQSFFS